MKSMTICILAAAAMVAPSATGSAFAEVPVTAGARVGFALPFGDVAKDSAMGDTTSGALPVQLDAAYRILPNLHVGLYLGYAPAMKGGKLADSLKDAPSDVSVSVSQLRYGLQGQYHLTPDEPKDAWVGIALGSESLRTAFSDGDDTKNSSLSGTEYGVQGGMTWTVAPKFRIGPTASLMLTSYSTADSDKSSGSKSSSSSKDLSSDDKTTHLWLTIGVGGTFSL